MTAAINAARAKGVKVIPTVTDGAGKGGMAAIIADPTQPGQPHRQPRGTVIAGGYDGIDLDYEVFAFTDGREHVGDDDAAAGCSSSTELSDALHAQGRLLIVTIPPVWEAPTPGAGQHDRRTTGSTPRTRSSRSSTSCG